jgi:D-inositol-3-phosphate glycosyltransferase
MKILWCGDSPTVSTGFARCTRAACDALHAAGHEVAVLGLNEFGDPHPYPYPIYPATNFMDGGRDVFGVGRLPRLIERLRPDVVVLLTDPWNVKGYVQAIDHSGVQPLPILVGWLAVDACNQVGRECNDLYAAVTWTEFAAQELHRGGYGGLTPVVGLGVDHDTFYPRDQAECRAAVLRAVDIPADAFIIGVVGRNQVRKRLDLICYYFAQWIRKHHVDNAYLLLHVAPTGDRGVDLQSLCNYLGISERVLLRTPNIGHGVTDQYLSLTYGCMDVLATTTQGEGWGLQVSEAMACGVPCLVPDWSGLGTQGGWPKGAAISVPCTNIALTAPQNSLLYTVGGVPDCGTFIQELQALYSAPLHRQAYRQRGLRRASTLSWERTGLEFRTALEDVVQAATRGREDRQAVESIGHDGPELVDTSTIVASG